MKFALLLIPIITAISCPPGYIDKGDGTCYNRFKTYSNRNWAYGQCANDEAYLFDIQNAFQNNWLQQQAGNEIKQVWLGLTCTDNTVISCIWDNGTPLKSTSYHNFYNGAPNVITGPCVVMLISSGQWYSTDCSTVNVFSMCKFTPGNKVQICNKSSDKNGVFRGECYFPVPSSSEEDGANVCKSNGGVIASIHNSGVNSFVRGIGQYYSPSSLYMFLGLKRNGDNYHWEDNSAVNFTFFGYQNIQLGDCTSMALKNDLLDAGKWINSQCADNSQTLVSVCQQTTVYPTVLSTFAPSQCGGTHFLSNFGTIYSPGYPLGSEPNHCEYMITEDMNSFALLTFESLSLDANSKIQLFSSIFDTVPFATITNRVATGLTYKSSTNVIKMVFDTAGSLNFQNYYYASYGSMNPTTIMPTLTTTTTVPPNPISCSFVLDWGYLGFNTMEYIKQRDFVKTVATLLYGSLEIIFQGNVGFYGNINSNNCFYSIINDDYEADATSFIEYLNSKIPSHDCPMDLCEALADLNDFISSTNPQRTCLVFFSGGSDDFNACGSPIDKTKYNVVIGAALSANTRVSEISDSVVNISSNFDQNDVETLVNQIISVALQKR